MAMSDGLYPLPNGWEWRKLGDLCEILDSKRRPISQKDRIVGEYPYYGASGILDYVNNYIFDEKLVLIGEDGAKWGANENTSFIANGKYWVNNHAHIFRPHRDICIDNYLVYFLNFSDLSEYITGATVKKLNQAKLKDIDIPLPPIDEQKRIVEKLDGLFAKIDKAIALLDESISSASALLPSALNEVFGELSEKWGIVEVGKITDCIVPQRNKPKDFKGDIPWITTEDLTLFEYVFRSSKNLGLTRLDIENVKSKTIPKDSVLMSCVGELGIVSIAGTEMVVNQQLHTYQCHDNLLNKYLAYALFFQKRLMYEIANVTTVAYMNKSKCNSIPIPIPPLDIQAETVAHLDAVREKSERLTVKLKSQRDELIALKASILDRAFKGEL